MTSFLVCYGTGEGQTAKVAARIVEGLRNGGHDAAAVDARALPRDLSLDAYDAVLVGSSIHAGNHQPAVRAFVTANRDALAARPTGFFQVSLSSALGGEEGRAQAAGYVETFVTTTDWHPDRVGLFGGALRFSEYGFLKRAFVKQVAKRAGGVTDTSRDQEFTDWDEVDRFTADFAAYVEGRLGAPSPAGSDEPAPET